MKKWVFTIIGGVILVLFIAGASIAWYHFFAKEEVSLTDFQVATSNIDPSITNQVPISDLVALKEINPYEIKIKNTGTGTKSYKLLIEEIPIDDGCNSNRLLTREQLRYQIVLNKEEIALGELKDVQDNVLDVESLGSGNENVYQIRIWVAERDEQQNLWNKHYHYRIRVIVE